MRAESVPQEHPGCYPEYRRRQMVERCRQLHGDHNLSPTTHMVPYNCFLSLRYNCHMMEICIGFRAVKYLY